MLLIIYAIGAVLLAAGKLVHVAGFFDSAHLVIECTFFGRAFEFFAGMFVARATEFIRPERRYGVVTWLSVAGVTATAMLLTRVQVGPHPAVETSTIGVLANNFVIPSLFALLLYGLLTERSLLRWVLATPVMDLFGRASYTFYLIHIGVIRDFLEPHISRGPAAVQLTTVFVAMNAAALLLFLAVEEPLNRAIRQVRFGKVAAPAAVQTSEA
jgi:peptidoglycan/LPS O-acetylase OafA/YrhL